MGYRSEVAYRIGFDDSQTLGLFIQHVIGSGDTHMIQALKECEVDFKEFFINFHASDVKWYESFPDVKGHKDMYELCDEEDTPFYDKCGYVFYRIGEESEDIENMEGGMNPPYEDFYTQTSLEMPFDREYKCYGDILAELTKQQPTKGDEA